MQAPEFIIELLMEGMQASRMKTASFAKSKYGMGDDEFTELVREQTQLYRETWVETPLAVVLAYLKGEVTVEQAQRLWQGDNHQPDADLREPLKLLGAEYLNKTRLTTEGSNNE